MNPHARGVHPPRKFPEMKATTFSLIIPTRQRTVVLRRLLDSVKATCRRLDELEAILVIDDDDEETIHFQYAGIDVKRVQVSPGLTMGALNMSGYRAATGRYLMLLNDDVILRTPDWDERVRAAFRSCSDGMVLVHVNDLVFRDTLCIFPFLTREFCAITGGICPDGYLRYRIDDHIHNIFDLISLLGHHRRLFLPDVIFEHLNVKASGGGAAAYVPDPAIHEIDSQLFHALLDERKRAALEAVSRIDGSLPSARREKLDPVTDSVAIRRPEHARWLATPKSSSGHEPRVTIGIVSADLRSSYTQKCIELVKTHTTNFELILIDNNRSPDFNHSREMNRILSICGNNYLVLMDDDVFVQAGWLQGLLRCVGPSVGVVTPLHKNRAGELSYAGIVMHPDDTGHHTHIMEAPSEPQRIQTLCSAIMLIDMTKCGHIRLDERYTKYFLDIDYGLQVWEEGFQVVCSPYSEVTHLAGATLEQGGRQAMPLLEEQRQRYFQAWVSSKRIHALRLGVWKTIPEISRIAVSTEEIERLLAEGAKQERDSFVRDASRVVRSLAAFPVVKEHIRERALMALGGKHARVDDPETGHLAVMLGLSGHQPVLFEEGFHGMNIVLQGFRYYALPQGEGAFDYDHMIHNGYSRSFEAEHPVAVQSLIVQYRQVPAPGHVVDPSLSASESPQPLSRERGAGAGGSAINPLAHFLETGARKGLKPNPLFDPSYYLSENPEVAEAGINPLAHFLESGAMQGRRPNPLFDTAWYLQQYPEVTEAGMNPLEHFLEMGTAQGHKPNPYFDPTYYLDQNPDVAATGINPLAHFLEYGARQGRRPSPLFDPAGYLEQNPDVAASGINPLTHFLMQNSGGDRNHQ